MDNDRHVMVDLETLGTLPTSVIATIGAVQLNQHAILDYFYVRVEMNDQREIGMTTDINTIVWWMQQSEKAVAEIIGEPRTPLRVALQQFADWYPNNATLWGNGSTFDNMILENAYRACKMQHPWGWNDHRCYRTLKNEVPHVPIDRQGVSHHALDDATNQALHLIKIWKELHNQEKRKSFLRRFLL